MSDQFQLDLEGKTIESQFNRNMAEQAHQWTPEAMAMHWVLGVSDWDWWRSFPAYKRREWIQAYEDAQLRRTGPAADQMQTFEQYQRASEEQYQQRLVVAQSWAKDIKDAWLHRKPCPISCDSLTGLDRLRCEHMLSWAFSLAEMKPDNFEGPQDPPA